MASLVSLLNGFGSRCGLQLDLNSDGVCAVRFANGLDFVFQTFEEDVVLYSVLKSGADIKANPQLCILCLECAFFDKTPPGFAVSVDPETGDLLAQSRRELETFSESSFESWILEFFSTASEIWEKLKD